MTELRPLAQRLLELNPKARRTLLIAVDAVLLPLAVWLSFWLGLSHPVSPQFLNCLWLLPASVLLGLPLYGLTYQYKGLTRYVGSTALYRLSLRNGLLVLLLAFVGAIFQLPLPPRRSWFLLWLLLTGLTGALRFTLRDIVLILQSTRESQLTRVAIYGAGSTGAQLSSSLRIRGGYRIITFLDDSPDLWSRTIYGIPIQPPQTLSRVREQLDQVLVAIPSLGRERRRTIVQAIQEQGVPVLQIPSVDDLTTGRAQIDALRPISIEDLLGRDIVPPDPLLMGPGIKDKIVCVTGAGGSIGSELCRQILKLKPRNLIVFEQSEPSLYAIHQELNEVLPNDVTLTPVLGNASETALVTRIFKEAKVEIVFHSAAYKHVPLVESNALQGISNNVLSTNVVCKAAIASSCEKFVLISTDKAVRPTNVMGASKRLAELVVHAHAEQVRLNQLQSPAKYQTGLSMVRFGNVLGSSGSVVPLFRKQIAAGGPITLTHPEMIRYFMTISEAAQLVMQAASLAKGGDIFLLDMGEPVKIKNLAEQMIRLSGFTLKNARNSDGDIEISCTGLRPGEKLYEELLIDAKSEPTSHPLIFRANEPAISPVELWPKLEDLEKALAQQNSALALNLLSELVPEWERQF